MIHRHKDTWMYGCVDAKMRKSVLSDLSSKNLKLVIQAKNKVEADRQTGFLSFLCLFIFSSALECGNF